MREVSFLFQVQSVYLSVCDDRYYGSVEAEVLIKSVRTGKILYN